jgi:D-alanyl-D-alanine carboxypeptidase (penicillin-binding protein 5/6)
MLESGGDAAVALAQFVSGSVDSFVDLMNERAAELGMTNTTFKNPIGMTASGHMTTAMDMALLAYNAMKNPNFRKIVGTYRYTPPTTNKHDADRPWYPTTWKNSNRLISTSDDAFAFNDQNGHAIGIKTGWTSAAQHTLVSAAISADGTQEVIAVVLNDTQTGKWTDCITMFMYAFDFYDTIDVGEFLTEDLTIKTHVENAADNDEYENLEMYVIPDTKEYITDTPAIIETIRSQPERFTREETYTRTLVAPVAKGEEIGTMDFYFDGSAEPILTCTLIAAEEVPATPVATREATPTPKPDTEATPAPEGKPGMVGYVGYVLAGAAGFALAVLLIVMIKRKTKYHQYHVSARGKHSAKRDR